MPGFTTVTRENVSVSVGQNTPVDVALKLSNIQETITVTSETPLLDPRKVETGQNFSHDELQEIPTSRDVWSLIQQVPGVQIDTVNVAGNQSGIAGGPDFITKGSGNVVYQIDGATTTDNTYGNPFQRQNGGTNTFFDFSTFQDVEVATGGSVVEQQTSGVTINVVTKRGTNEFHGAGRFIYASGNWQSTNTPQEAIDQGIQTNSTKMLRDYGSGLRRPDHQGQALAVVRRRLPDDLDDHHRGSRPGRSAVEGEPRALEREAELADRELQLGAALLPAQLPRPVQRQPRADTRRPGGDAAHDPDQLLQGRGLARLRVGPLRFALRGLPEPRLHESRQRLEGLRQRPVPGRVRRGPDEGRVLGRSAVSQQLCVLLGQGSAEAGQLLSLQVLHHGLGQPRAEVQLQLPRSRSRTRRRAGRAISSSAASTRTRLRTRR